MTQDRVVRSKTILAARRFGVAFVLVVAGTSAMPSAMADPTSDLQSAVDTARSSAGCPHFQFDQGLSDISLRVAHEANDYVKHTAQIFPTNQEIPLIAPGDGGLLRIMREAGYGTNKTKLIDGYGDHRVGGSGDNEAKAIKAAILQGEAFDVLSDCSYTKYGVSAINDDGNGGWPSTAPRSFSVAIVVLAGA